MWNVQGPSRDLCAAFVLALAIATTLSFATPVNAATPKSLAKARPVQPGFPAVPDYNEQYAYLMLAYAAFCEPGSGLTSWTCFWCDKYGRDAHVHVEHVIEDDGDEGIYGYIASVENSSATNFEPFVVVSFRGSSTVENWETDFEFWEEAFPEVPNAKIHYGFYTAWLKVRSQVLKETAAIAASLSQKHSKSGVMVLNTGHSLGAAMSTISAMEMFRANISHVSEVRMINFGQPRVGNLALAVYAQSILPYHFRVVNHRDLVPHIPPMFVEYRHAPRELWYKSSYTEFKICSPYNGEDSECSDGDYLFTPADHLMYLGVNVHDGASHGCGHPTVPALVGKRSI